jgi:hypothetical protein
MQLEVGQQNANLRHARRVVNAVRVDHRQAEGFQVEQANGCLLGRKAELLP